MSTREFCFLFVYTPYYDVWLINSVTWVNSQVTLISPGYSLNVHGVAWNYNMFIIQWCIYVLRFLHVGICAFYRKRKAQSTESTSDLRFLYGSTSTESTSNLRFPWMPGQSNHGVLCPSTWCVMAWTVASVNQCEEFCVLLTMAWLRCCLRCMIQQYKNSDSEQRKDLLNNGGILKGDLLFEL